MSSILNDFTSSYYLSICCLVYNFCEVVFVHRVLIPTRTFYAFLNYFYRFMDHDILWMSLI